MRWQQLEQRGDLPGPRSSHAICAVGDDSVYLCGGELEPRIPVANDLFIYSRQTQQWRKLRTLGTQPGPRVAATMAAVGSHIFLFGGRTGVEMGDGAQADLLAFDTESLAWSPVATAGSRPPPRSFHAMAAAGGRLWLFGGCGMAGRLCDLWCFTPGSAGPATGEWAQLPSCPGLGPRGGAVLAAAPDGSRLWVMGGFNGSELADVHEYETASGTWRCCCSSSTQATAAGKQEPTAAAEPDNASAPAIEPMPVGRSVFGAAAHGATAAPGCCSHRGHVVTFGGEVAPSDKGHAGAGSFCAATLCFAPAEAPGAGGGWHTVDAAGVGPGPRGWFAATSVGGGGLLVHGGLGADNERLGDMHLLTLH